MTGIRATGEKRLVVVSGRAHPALAEAVAEELSTQLLPVDFRSYPDGEVYARMDESVRGCDVFVIQSHAAPINEAVMEQLIMVDALKRASAKRITVVAPYYPYARQDKKHRGREPISARLMADLFKTAGADRLMVGPLDHLFAMPLLLKHIRETVELSNAIVVSPDMGRVRVADVWSDTLDVPLAIIHKRRDPLVPNQVSVHEIVGDVRGKMCLVVDDMISTGSTIVKAAQALRENGALGVIVAATHAVFSANAAQVLASEHIHRVIVTDTLPLAPEKRFEKLTVLSIAPLIARAIHEVFEDGSVTSMFDGAA